MKKLKCILSVAVLLAAFSVFASATETLLATRRGRDASIKLGRWHSNLEKAKAYCEANGVPLVAVWSNGDNCGHCVKLENNANSDAFTSWMKNSGIVFYFAYYGDAYPEGTLEPSCWWCSGDNPYGRTLPFVRIYWMKNGVTKADTITDGDTWDGYKGKSTLSNNKSDPDNFVYPGDYQTYNPGGRYMINYLTNGVNGVLRKYKYSPTTPVTYYGGEMACYDPAVAPNACLQAEYAGDKLLTTNVVVTLFRTNAQAVANVATNRLAVTHPTGPNGLPKVKNYDVVWAKGETNKTVDVKLTEGWDDISVSNRIHLVLSSLAIAGATTNCAGHATNDVLIVKNLANSPKNPLWLGERTADTLQYGEWTMDLDVLTNKVRAVNAVKSKKAYSMVLVGGSCWCPDCAAADKFLYDTDAFRAWAKDRQVALGVVDIPNSAATASLLTENVVAVSDAFVTCRNAVQADEKERYQSGRSYLSRKMIAPAAAAAVAARNAALASADVLEGGFRRVDWANESRPGVPTLFLLRDDGTIAARWALFADLGPSEYNANYLKRLDEMLALANDEHEEANDQWQTTRDVVAKRGNVAGRTLSHVDLTDCYRIDKAALNTETSFKIRSEVSALEVTAQILEVSPTTGDTRVVAETAGVLAEGLDVTAVVPSTNCYLVVKAETVTSAKTGTPASPLLAATNATSTVAPYSIKSDSVLSPLEKVMTEIIALGDPLYAAHTVTIKTEAQQAYKITNVDESAIEGVFLKSASEDDVYVALVDGPCTVTLKDKDAENAYRTDYQIWNTGKIGFTRATGTVEEPASDSTAEGEVYVDYTLSVARVGGTSGAAAVRISFDAASSEGITNNVCGWDHEGAVLRWAEGDDATTNLSVRILANEFADGDQKLVFKLERVSGDAGLGAASHELTVVDDDQPVAGTLRIRRTVPAMGKAMTVFAQPGATLKFYVDRQDGTFGCVTGKLETTAGTLSVQSLVWNGRESREQEVELKLPADFAAAAQVTLSAEGDVRIDPAAKYLTVKPLACAAAFKDDVRSLVAAKGVPMAAAEIAVDETTLDGIGVVSVKKYSGSLAPGLSASYDAAAKKLVVAGAPTRAGTWTANYRVYGDDVPGQVVALVVTVVDPAAPAVKGVTANPGLAASRSYSDVLVFDVTTSNYVGVISLTVPPSGRVSAKFRSVLGDVTTFLADSWSGTESDVLNGRYVAEPAVVTGNDQAAIRVVADPDALTVAYADASTKHAYECVLPYDWYANGPATAWAGYYTVSLPITNQVGEAQYASGAGYVALSMRTNDAASCAEGRMTYAGVLPNGKAFYGSAILTPDAWNGDFATWGAALVPIQSSSSTDCLRGVLSIKREAAARHVTERRAVSVYKYGRLYWEYDPRGGLREGTSVPDEVSIGELDALGGYYDETEDFASCCQQVFSTAQLTFFAETDLLPADAAFGWAAAAREWCTNATAVKSWKTGAGVNKIRLVDAASAKAQNGLTFVFDRTTGLVSGQFDVAFESGSSVKATFQGVVMPGWGSAACLECTLGNGDSLLRPFISGPAWFADVYNYKDGRGRDRQLKIKRGLPFSVGTEPGK